MLHGIQWDSRPKKIVGSMPEPDVDPIQKGVSNHTAFAVAEL